MSERAAINVICDVDMIQESKQSFVAMEKHVTTLSHWWGTLEDILPILAGLKNTRLAEMDMVKALFMVTEFIGIDSFSLDEFPEKWNKIQERYLYTYNLFLTKAGWDVEVWANPACPFVEDDNPTVVDESSPLSKLQISGHISHILTDRIAIVPRIPLRKLTKGIMAVAQAAQEKEVDRAREIAKKELAVAARQ